MWYVGTPQKQNERDASRVAMNRTRSTGTRHRLVDVDGHLARRV